MGNPKWTVGVVVLICSVVAFAQPGEADNWTEWQLKRLEERLNLTPEQKPKVEAILKEQREKIRAVHGETQERLRKVLTAEQTEKFENLRREKKERWRQHLRQRFSQP